MLSFRDFDFSLPPEQIAQEAIEPRDHARLMVVDSTSNEHHRFDALPALLDRLVGRNPLLVFNDTRVIPARLHGHKQTATDMGGRVELLLCDRLVQAEGIEHWRCMVRSSKPLRAGTSIALDGDRPPKTTVLENQGGGFAVLVFSFDPQEHFLDVLGRIGQVPLPPYIHHGKQRETDPTQYQTVFAKHPGAVAAPTAGLHFTSDLLKKLADHGTEQAFVTLHVGPGTFAPIKSESIESHIMHAELYHIPAATAAAIARAKQENRPVVAVGTTVTRALESATPLGAAVPSIGNGNTTLFIYPPYAFRCIDAMITNFHLPKSTLLMLVAAFAGKTRILAAYREAIERGYRFFSYGDAMLIPRAMS